MDVAAALQRLGPRAEYVRISGAGRNALDFYIACYVERLACAEPDAYFHVIALDKGYDPLLEHLKAQGIQTARWADVKDIPTVRTNGAVPTERSSSRTWSDEARNALGRSRHVLEAWPRCSRQSCRRPRSQGFWKSCGAIFVVNGTKVTYALPE